MPFKKIIHFFEKIEIRKKKTLEQKTKNSYFSKKIPTGKKKSGVSNVLEKIPEKMRKKSGGTLN